MIFSLPIIFGRGMHLFEQYFFLAVNSLPQVRQSLIFGRRLGDFELLVMAAHDLEQKQMLDEEMSLGLLLKMLPQCGLAQ